MQAKSEHAILYICKRYVRHCGNTVKEKAHGDNLAGFAVSETDTFIEFQCSWGQCNLAKLYLPPTLSLHIQVRIQ